MARMGGGGDALAEIAVHIEEIGHLSNGSSLAGKGIDEGGELRLEAVSDPVT